MWSATGLKWPEYRYNFDNRTRWWNDLFENDFHEKEFPQTHRLVDKNRAICLLLLCFRFECGFIKFKSVQIETKREMPRFTIDIPFSWICVLYLFWPVCRTAHSTHIVSQSKNVWYHTNLHQQQQQQRTWPNLQRLTRAKLSFIIIVCRCKLAFKIEAKWN